MSEVEKPGVTPSLQMSHLYHKDLAAHTGPSLEASEHQQDCSGVQKIVWRANMEKTARRNIIAINKD